MPDQVIFRAAPGSRLSDADATEAGKLLETMAAAKGVEQQHLLPADIVAAATPVESPLHRFFEWDKEKNAYQHLLTQARYLVRSIRIEIVRDTRPEPTTFLVPSMVSIRTGPEPQERAYVPLQVALDTPEYLAQIKAEAQQKARQWYQRYRQYRELTEFADMGPLFDLLEQTVA